MTYQKMALAQYLSTLGPTHTADEVITSWPMYFRLYADRALMITLGAGGPDERIIGRLINLPLLHVHIKEDCNQCVQKVAAVVDAYLNEPSPPPGVRAVHVPNEWGVLL
jgi:hypothetical protein